MPVVVTNPTPPAIAFDDIPERRVVNETGKRMYQRRCTWQRTCAACGQYHGRLHDGSGADVPSIPLHIHCGCLDNPVAVGESTRGYPEPGDIAAQLNREQQQRYMGRANYDLWQAGKLDFSQIVGRRTVRPLASTASRVKIPASVTHGKTGEDLRLAFRGHFERLGVPRQAAARAATARLSIEEQAIAVRRAFDDLIEGFPVTVAELRDVVGVEVAKGILGGKISLRTAVGDALGPELARRYLDGEISPGVARRARGG